MSSLDCTWLADGSLRLVLLTGVNNIKHMNTVIKYVLVCIFLGANALGLDAPVKVDVLGVAKSIGDRLRSEGYIYPYKNQPAGTKTVDCTEFILKVLDKVVPDLPAAAKRRVAMNDLSADDVTVDKGGIITSGDPRTKGVQQALMDAGHGTVVPLLEVKPGDLIQYWMLREDGTWAGHAAIVERVEVAGRQARAWLYGSHSTKKGIGTAPDAGLRLILSDDRRIYPVRIK